jgi:hypothetical protein
MLPDFYAHIVSAVFMLDFRTPGENSYVKPAESQLSCLLS